MLANTQPAGIDLLGQLADVAAVRAIDRLGRPIVLARCDEVAISSALIGRALRLEAWLVREDDRDATVAAFAMLHESCGMERIAASGRFTFSILPIEKDPDA